MSTKRANRTITAALFGLATVALPLATTGAAQAHGYTANPPSRQALCADGTVQNCGSIQWEPQSVEGPGNFPTGGPADGALCSGGNGRFSVLDDPRGGSWPATDVRPGQQVSFTWTITAGHSTESFRYFITKNSWDPSKPLTRDQLELTPVEQVDLGGAQPGDTVTHQVTLPGDKTGRHLVFAVWEIADTSNAFYACSDVNFGGAATSPAGAEPASSGPDSAPAADAAGTTQRGQDGAWSWFSSLFA